MRSLFGHCWQVTSSSWSNDLRDQVEHTRVLSVVYRSATAIGSRLPSIASAKARVAGAGAILRPVSSGTQVKSVKSVVHNTNIMHLQSYQRKRSWLYE